MLQALEAERADSLGVAEVEQSVLGIVSKDDVQERTLE